MSRDPQHLKEQYRLEEQAKNYINAWRRYGAAKRSKLCRMEIYKHALLAHRELNRLYVMHELAVRFRPAKTFANPWRYLAVKPPKISQKAPPQKVGEGPRPPKSGYPEFPLPQPEPESPPPPPQIILHWWVVEKKPRKRKKKKNVP